MTNAAWRPTLIVGAPRSGTTLLAVMLSRHSAVAVGPETHFFHTFLPRVPRAARGDQQRLLDLALRDRRIRDLRLSRDQVVSRLSPDAGPGDLFCALLDANAAEQGKSLWAEKSPDHIFQVDEIRRHLPDARFVCCLRDGRDVALSLDRVPWRKGSLWGHAAMWVRAAREAERLQQELGPAEFLLVRYEDLVTRPTPTLQKVATFLGLEFEEAMLTATDRDTDAIPERERAWKGKAAEQPDGSRIGAWRTTATPRQRCLLNLVEGTYLRRFGYPDADTHGCPPSLRIEHLARRLADRARLTRLRWLIRRRTPSRSDPR